MGSATLWETKYDLNPFSETITPFNMGKIISFRSRIKPITPNNMRFPQEKSTVSVLFKDNETYFGNGNDFQEDFLGTIDIQEGIAAREWVYTVDDLVIRSVKDTFMHADKVDSIYGHTEKSVFSLLVFISVSKYDDRLAEQLAAYEIELEDRFTWVTFDFHYVPVALGHDSIITEQDACYFKREWL